MESRESVAQLQGVPDEPLRRGRRDPQHRTELSDAELRHQGRTGSCDGFLVFAAGDGERGGGVDRLRPVEVRPPRGEIELTGSGSVLGVAGGADRGEQAGGGEVVVDLRGGLLERLDHVFDYSTSRR
ncbi:hypothetical protein F4692_001496 [Nocardioides cavernae]|uniref:Uncharacterized protein n=1 Tax=Nocardioides cavernae TaxID=1921566 RepID=A0A7Y9H1U4_9ACTN|nr:hypothetical protein [Nocardioides cavernae]NYE36392.1 hypothetical protein [Nocardioides cavernae]